MTPRAVGLAEGILDRGSYGLLTAALEDSLFICPLRDTYSTQISSELRLGLLYRCSCPQVRVFGTSRPTFQFNRR